LWWWKTPAILITQEADQDDCGSMPTNSSRDLILKIPNTKNGASRMTLEHLPSKREALSSNPNTKKKKRVSERHAEGAQKC
jgi:hypothetical protein